MERGSEEVQRLVHEGHGGQPRMALGQVQLERLNGDSRHLQQVDSDQQQSLGDSRGPAHDNPRSSDADGEHEDITNHARPPGRSDDEFATFHRSFTVAATPLDSRAVRSVYGPLPALSWRVHVWDWYQRNGVECSVKNSYPMMSVPPSTSNRGNMMFCMLSVRQ